MRRWIALLFCVTAAQHEPWSKEWRCTDRDNETACLDVSTCRKGAARRRAIVSVFDAHVALPRSAVALKATVAAAARRAGADCVFLLPAEQLRRVDVDASALADFAAAGVLVREVPWIVPPHLSPRVPVESGGCCGLCGNQIFNPTAMCA